MRVSSRRALENRRMTLNRSVRAQSGKRSDNDIVAVKIIDKIKKLCKKRIAVSNWRNQFHLT